MRIEATSICLPRPPSLFVVLVLAAVTVYSRWQLKTIPARSSQQMRRFTKIGVVKSSDGSGCGMESPLSARVLYCRHRRHCHPARLRLLFCFVSIRLGWARLGRWLLGVLGSVWLGAMCDA